MKLGKAIAMRAIRMAEIITKSLYTWTGGVAFLERLFITVVFTGYGNTRLLFVGSWPAIVSQCGIPYGMDAFGRWCGPWYGEGDVGTEDIEEYKHEELHILQDFETWCE